VRDIEMVDVTGNTIILGAANEYARGWLEERLTTIVERALSKVAGESIQVGFVVSDEIER
jgi:chromosomal replication initiation ATPase DnaA